ncbi:hypothetical protein J7T55_005933 [Diaporthe amygdali]|uniref:uncharacterized protein n=1 Tax=Phomopsis amygdali TaxID=1214568 RepID=UPI0022FE6175|nr:uncharacterized protein J7T55_005933 [Diaporthe amygdali]KAJ0124594.1 hypothetical protein J7T55_005933 [Diaporthe amygdali]
MLPPPSGSFVQERKFKNNEGPPKRRSYRKRNDSKWTMMEDKIAKLYSRMPLRVVREIMWCIYSFEEEESEYKKQFSLWRNVDPTRLDTTGEQGREKENPKRPDIAIQTIMVALEEFTLQSQATKQAAIALSTSQMETQEKILLGLDRYIRAVFSPTNGAWGFNMLSFISPTGDATTLNLWERLADQCTTIEDLMKNGLVGKAQYLMDDLLGSLPTGSRSTDPSMLLQLWQACLKLLSIEKRRLLKDRALIKLLEAIKQNLTAAKEENGDILMVVEALVSVSCSRMKTTLRLATFKTVMTLQELIGDENIMVLGLWSLYCRTWKTSQRSRDALLKKLEHVRKATQQAPLSDVITLSYYHTYAVHSASNDRAKSAEMARDLIHRVVALPLPCKPIWSMQTLAFQVCSKLWARHLRSCAFAEVDEHEKLNKRYTYFKVMEDAVSILEKGDIICRVSAASMARTLGHWLGKSELPNCAAIDWHSHAKDILRALPGSEQE